MKTRIALLSRNTLLYEGLRSTLSAGKGKWDLHSYRQWSEGKAQQNKHIHVLVVDGSEDGVWLTDNARMLRSWTIDRVLRLGTDQVDTFVDFLFPNRKIEIVPIHESVGSIHQSLGIEHAPRFEERMDLILTKREKEIVKHMIDGKTSEEIALALYISAQTAKTHRKNILRKLGYKNTRQLVLEAK